MLLRDALFMNLLIILLEIIDFRIDHSETVKPCLMKLSVSGIHELLSSSILDFWIPNVTDRLPAGMGHVTYLCTRK